MWRSCHAVAVPRTLTWKRQIWPIFKFQEVSCLMTRIYCSPGWEKRGGNPERGASLASDWLREPPLPETVFIWLQFHTSGDKASWSIRMEGKTLDVVRVLQIMTLILFLKVLKIEKFAQIWSKFSSESHHVINCLKSWNLFLLSRAQNNCDGGGKINELVWIFVRLFDGFPLSAKKHTPALETSNARTEESVPWEEGKYCCGSPCHGTRKPRISPALFREGG